MRSVKWSSVLAGAFVVATVLSIVVAPEFVLGFGLSAIALAVLAGLDE